MTLRELDEAVIWKSRNVLSSSAVKFLTKDLERLAGRDRGVGAKEVRTQLQGLLRSSLTAGSRHHRMLVQLTDLIQDGYVQRWAAAFASFPPPAPERIARALASHLLDCGYSMPFLHRWVRGHIGAGNTLGDLLDSAAELASHPGRNFEVLVPFTAIPQAADLAHHLEEWISPRGVARWVAEHTDSDPIRQNGGFRYRLLARDPFAAAELAEQTVARVRARAGYTRKRGRGHHIPVPYGVVWVRDPASGATEKIAHRQEISRGAFVLSLQTERRVYDASEPTPLDDALELAAPLNDGQPGPAISGGWAAIEALLVSPDDPDDSKERGVVAAERMSSLVACSWPRAEFTALSYQHFPTTPDRLTAELGVVATNQQRAELVARAIEGQRYLSLAKQSDRAAQERMTKLVADPRLVLSDVNKHITSALRRLYRQRNLLMHGGSTGSIALSATLRTAAPLVGAGLDRLTHAALTDGCTALDL